MWGDTIQSNFVISFSLKGHSKNSKNGCQKLPVACEGSLQANGEQSFPCCHSYPRRGQGVCALEMSLMCVCGWLGKVGSWVRPRGGRVPGRGAAEGGGGREGGIRSVTGWGCSSSAYLCLQAQTVGQGPVVTRGDLRPQSVGE